MARRRSRYGDQNRRKFWGGLIKLVILLTIIGVVGFYGYQAGRQVMATEVAELRSEVERLTTSDQTARSELAEAQAQRDTAQKQAADYRANLDQLQLTPELQDLLGVMRQRLQAGVDAPRLASALRAADRPRTCREPISKRLTVDGAGGPAVNWVRFGEQVTVTAQSQDGVFDATKPVALRFAVIGGGQTAEAVGVLPLHQSVMVRNVEYRFTVTSSAKGTVDIASERCELK